MVISSGSPDINVVVSAIVAEAPELGAVSGIVAVLDVLAVIRVVVAASLVVAVDAPDVEETYTSSVVAGVLACKVSGVVIPVLVRAVVSAAVTSVVMTSVVVTSAVMTSVVVTSVVVTSAVVTSAVVLSDKQAYPTDVATGVKVYVPGYGSNLTAYVSLFLCPYRYATNRVLEELSTV